MKMAGDAITSEDNQKEGYFGDFHKFVVPHWSLRGEELSLFKDLEIESL